MTDKEMDIFHSLIYCKNMNKTCSKKYCSYGKHKDSCIGELMQDTIDLIVKQEEEIERLKRQKDIVDKFISESWRRIDELDKINETARAEAIKEFEDKLYNYIISNKQVNEVMIIEKMTSLKKEMVGKNNG